MNNSNESHAAAVAPQFGLPVPRFETIAEATVAGLTRKYDMQTRGNIPKQWGEFVPRMNATPDRAGDVNDSYGICWNMREDCSFDYLTGVEVSTTANLPTDFESVKIHAGRYAVFTHVGPIATLPQMIDTIWTRWVPASGLRPSHAPCFERYTAAFNEQTGGTELWIPLA